MQLLKDAVFAIRIAVADPDLRVKGGGGHPDPEIRGVASVWSENKEGGPPGPLPLIRHWIVLGRKLRLQNG